MINKKLVEQRFKEKSESYNENAILQKNIAKSLVKVLLKKCGNKFNKIFEIGCGTGFLTEEICNNLEYNELILNDLYKSEKFLEKYKSEFLLGDIEKIDFPKNLDLVISSSVFQWLEDFEKLVVNVKNSLNKDGIFAFSMFIDGNFKEIKDAFGIGLNYYDNISLKKILERYFDIIFYEDRKEILYFNDIFDLLKYIQKTGINAIEQNKWTKETLNACIKKYIKKYCLNDKCVLSYNYNFIILKGK